MSKKINLFEEPMSPKARIKAIAQTHAPDYPGIKEAGVYECLYAIESTLQGITAANEDLHLFLAEIRKIYNISDEEYLSIWDSINLEPVGGKDAS